MHQYVAPSIMKAAESEDNPLEWLAERYADQRWDSDTPTELYDQIKREGKSIGKHAIDVLVREVADFAINLNYGTTNGGWEVYLDNGWSSVPWCSEDELLEWYA